MPTHPLSQLVLKTTCTSLINTLCKLTQTHTLWCLPAAPLPQSAPPTTLLQPLGDMMGDGLPDDNLMEDSLMGLRETDMLDMLLG